MGVGGGITHLKEILRNLEPNEHGIDGIIVWGGKRTLKQLPHKSWLTLSHQRLLDRSLPFRFYWQLIVLTRLAQAYCDILFVPGGSYLGNFHPFVTMSRNMLPFMKQELRRYGFSLLRLKFLSARLIQLSTIKRCDGIIFLNEHARHKILQYTNSPVKAKRIIPHGVDERFFRKPVHQQTFTNRSYIIPIDLLYISHIEKYKHQWHVIQAIANLRDRGIPIKLTLVGGMGNAGKEFQKALNRFDPKQEFVQYLGKVDYSNLETIYHNSDLFIYASTCENLPNILIEAMASGLPIVCSNREPMPSLLMDGGVYFDPEKPDEIVDALLEIIEDPEKRERMIRRSIELAKSYSWEKCASSTFSFLEDIFNGFSELD